MMGNRKPWLNFKKDDTGETSQKKQEEKLNDTNESFDKDKIEKERIIQ